MAIAVQRQDFQFIKAQKANDKFELLMSRISPERSLKNLKNTVVSNK